MLDFQGQGPCWIFKVKAVNGIWKVKALSFTSPSWKVMASRRSSCERKVHHHPSLLHPPPKKDEGQEDPRVKIEFMKGLGEGVWEVWAS